ncbi:tetratricopeptide repeat protein [Brucella sp. IR073]|uniref:tetratricopeptide repeat protein n=1 Tax=unclassified Brucella TaxID=2632610 RepID=UPI003B97F6E3
MNAQERLGVAYGGGFLGLPQDFQRATLWTAKAAEQRNPVAQNTLGTAYLSGQGVAKDENTAVDWFRKAALQGNQDAISNLRALGITQ